MGGRRLHFLRNVRALSVRMYFGALIISAISVPAEGGLIAPSLFSFAGEEINSTNFTGNSGSGPALVEDDGTTTIGGGTFSYDASASAAYGELKGYSSSTSTAMTSPQSTGAGTDSGFTDVLTVNYAPLTGLQGFMTVDYALDGTSTVTGPAGAGATVVTSVSNGAEFVGASESVQLYAGVVSGTFSVPYLVAFTYGTPFNISFQMLTGAGTFNVTAGGGILLLPTTLAASGTSDFSDTLVLSGLTTSDSQGNPTPLATFTSGSGTTYTQDGIVTPEPSVVLLLGSGIISILALCGICRVVRVRAGIADGKT